MQTLHQSQIDNCVDLIIVLERAKMNLEICLAAVLAVFLVLIVPASLGSKLSEVSVEEKAALEKFRPLVNDILVQDYQKLDSYLLRWLRDNRLNIKAAATALTESQQWRKEKKIDTILSENLSFTDRPETIDGFDNEGRPIIIWNAKKLDVRGIVVRGEQEKFLRYTIQVLEKINLKAREAMNGTGLDSQLVSILDIDGYNLKQHGCLQCFSVYADWTRHVSKYYPGSLKYDIWINVPRIARPVLELVKPLRSPLYQKAHLDFDTDKSEWSTFLLSIIPKDQLGFQYGGTKSEKS